MAGLCLSYHWLNWRHHPSQPEPCPDGIERTFIDSPGGQLEMLTSGPVGPAAPAGAGADADADARVKPPPPLYFVHGGMGSAFVWTEYMQFLGGLGIPCYAVSMRGHGNSWYPSFLRMVWATSKRALADDVVAGIRYAEGREGQEVVLVGHSSGAGLVQFILSEGDVKAKGVALLGALPGYGSTSVYMNWYKADPWFSIRMILHGYHINSPISHPALTKNAFFSDAIPDAYVEDFQRRLAPYDSFIWTFGMMKPFVDAKKAMSSVVGSGAASGLKMLVMSGGEDVITTPAIAVKLASFYRKGQEQADSSDAPREPVPEPESDLTRAGVRCAFVEGAGHHLQNDVTWKDGAEMLRKFYEDVQV